MNCVDKGLTFLVRLTNDMGLEEVQEYANKLKKAEKMRDVREQVCLTPFFKFKQISMKHLQLFNVSKREKSV